jgi:hypothetical protein
MPLRGMPAMIGICHLYRKPGKMLL